MVRTTSPFPPPRLLLKSAPALPPEEELLLANKGPTASLLVFRIRTPPRPGSRVWKVLEVENCPLTAGLASFSPRPDTVINSRIARFPNFETSAAPRGDRGFLFAATVASLSLLVSTFTITELWCKRSCVPPKFVCPGPNSFAHQQQQQRGGKKQTNQQKKRERTKAQANGIYCLPSECALGLVPWSPTTGHGLVPWVATTITAVVVPHQK